MIEIYITSDNSIMNEDDLINWLLFNIKNNEGRQYWTFDELTGGVDEFIDKLSYEKAKTRFENITKNEYSKQKLN